MSRVIIKILKLILKLTGNQLKAKIGVMESDFFVLVRRHAGAF